MQVQAKNCEPMPDLQLRARIGVIGPLDVIDTSAYEFYLSAPPGVILAATSIGLRAFTSEAAHLAFENLDRCLIDLRERKVDVIMLNGLPLLLHLDHERVKAFRTKAAAIAHRGGWTAVDAALAALRTLGITRPAVANKWSTNLSQRLKAVLEGTGLSVAGIVNRHVELTTIKGDYADGTRTAHELALTAIKEAPNADGVFLAGGAWLTLHLIEELEAMLGVPVVSSIQTTNWFALNVAGVFEPRQLQGSLMRAQLSEGAGAATR